MDIVDRGSMIVIGIPIRANWKDLWVDVPEAWREFVRRHAEVRHPVGETFYDTSLEKNGDEYVQLVGSHVSKVDRIPAGMHAVEISAQQYIHHTHEGPTKAIAETFGTMYEWARQNGEPAGEFKLDSGYTVAGDELQHDLFIGLLPEKGWREVTDSLERAEANRKSR